MRHQITEVENESDLESIDDLNWAKVTEGPEFNYEELQAEIFDVTSLASPSAYSSTPEFSSRSVSSVSSTMRDWHADSTFDTRWPYIPSKEIVASRNSSCSTAIPGSHDKNPQGSEHAFFFKQPFGSKSSAISASTSLIYGKKMSQDAKTKPHRFQTKSKESQTFPYPWSGLLVYFYNACIDVRSGLISFLRSHKYMSWFVLLVVWTGFLICAERYFRTSINNLFHCLLAGLLFSKTPCNPSQTLGHGSPWFEDPTLGSELAQVNSKLVKIADISVLEAMPSGLMLVQEEINKLRSKIEDFSVVPSKQVLNHLSRYTWLSAVIEVGVQSFNRGLKVTLLGTFSLTQSTIGGLRHIAEIEANQTYLAWTCIYIDGRKFGRTTHLGDFSGCSTGLSAALFVGHISQVVLKISFLEGQAELLVKTFRRLRGHLKDVDKVRKRHKFLSMKEFYARYDEEIETTLWTKIKFFLEGDKSIPVLDISEAEIDAVQLALSFTAFLEEYFVKILSELGELEAQLTDLKNRANTQARWTFKCGFQNPPIRLWIKQLMLSMPVLSPVQNRPPGRRKIAMSSEG